MLDPIVFHSAVLVSSICVILYAADLLIGAISDYARKFGLSDSLIGLLIVASAASLPEIIGALTGLQLNDTNAMFGTILGSNMVHVALLTGILIIVGRKLTLTCELLENNKLVLFFLLTLPLLLGLDGTLSRLDGIVLIGAFAMYVRELLKTEQSLGRLKKDVPFKLLWKDMAIFAGSLISIILAGRWLVYSSSELATAFEIPLYFVALTIIGISGAVPDFAVEIRSLMAGHYAIGLGDALGSTILEFLLFFGMVALIRPIPVDLLAVGNAAIWLLASLAVLLYFIHIKKVTRKHGLILLGMYAAWLLIEIAKVN